ncbi:MULTISPECIES: hypothetical protein [Asticcacaulis]|uniref:hypothetical protein n=1 Tax=Asticcacaulis TaxID=76890 RepID=UPI001AE31E5C|nr:MULTISPECIES: hypothetical protein [Asticcacaulis]MBP2160259.1 hypothetical protein [Asticcacaulis solisilvae]MDR6801438.1 hypothetical protein [Asticcacaulis sp. BE141]
MAPSRSELTLKGLPVGYVLSPGDYLGFSYGAEPERHALHDLASGGTANEDGEVTVEVSGFVRLGALANRPVNPCPAGVQGRPYPGNGVARHRRGQYITGIGFKWRQTLR